MILVPFWDEVFCLQILQKRFARMCGENNKKIGENSLLDSRIRELIVLTTELLDFGVEVFDNDEEKFQRWLKKPNLSLGGISPESLLDTTTGIDEVKFALNRIEFGNLA